MRRSSLPAPSRCNRAHAPESRRACLQALFTRACERHQPHVARRPRQSYFARREARRFSRSRRRVRARLARDGVVGAWAFVARERRLSPRGCADLLAVTLFSTISSAHDRSVGRDRERPGRTAVERAQRVAASPLGAAWRTRPATTCRAARDVTANRIAHPPSSWQLDAVVEPRATPARAVLVAGYSVGEVAACAIGARLRAGRHRARRARGSWTRLRLPLRACGGPPDCFERDVDALCRGAGGDRHPQRTASFHRGRRARTSTRVVMEALTAGAARTAFAVSHARAHALMLAAAVPRLRGMPGTHASGAVARPGDLGHRRIARRSPGEVVSRLSRQVATRLDWSACMDAIGEMQPDAVLELGPCNALARMLAGGGPWRAGARDRGFPRSDGGRRVDPRAGRWAGAQRPAAILPP